MSTDPIRAIRLTDSGKNVYTPDTSSGYDLRGIQALVYEATPDPIQGRVDDTGLRTHPCGNPL